MPLEITRSFVENRDGTFDLYEPPKSLTENGTDVACKTDNQPAIKPFELKTFLKVGECFQSDCRSKTIFLGRDSCFRFLVTGNTSPDQKDPTPFIIEWIPDILPKLKIGELRLKFEYGHQRNGQLDYRPPPVSQIIHLQAIP